MFAVDTNVLLYASEPSFPEHARCRELLEAWRREPTPWYLTWGVVYEFLRVATHPRVFRTPWSVSGAWSFVEALLESPGLRTLSPTDRHAEVARQTVEELPHLAGNLLHDAHTAILMREHGVRVLYTRDTDFHRFPFVEVRDPLTSV
jgi:toxin-antitoxin system PIN domain toxin